MCYLPGSHNLFCRLDKCLQSILVSTNNLPGSRTFSTPKDALGYVCSSHTLEKDTCYDPEPEEAIAIIVALVSYLIYWK